MMFINSKCLIELSYRLGSVKTIISLRVRRSSSNSIMLFVNFKASLSGTIKAAKFLIFTGCDKLIEILNHINKHRVDFRQHHVML